MILPQFVKFPQSLGCRNHSQVPDVSTVPQNYRLKRFETMEIKFFSISKIIIEMNENYW